MGLEGTLAKYLPQLFAQDGVEIGPIPAGTPIDLLSNINLLPETKDPAERLAYQARVLDLLIKLKADLKALPAGASEDEARKVFANLVGPLTAVSKCPDYIVNRGHYFGTDKFAEEPGLSDDDKKALIAFVKTF